MKKLISILILTLLMAFSLTACNSQEAPSDVASESANAEAEARVAELEAALAEAEAKAEEAAELDLDSEELAAAEAELEALAAELEAAQTAVEEAASMGEEPVTITVFALQTTGRDLVTNKFSLLLEEKFNVQFDWQTVPWDPIAAKEGRQLSLASGDYPDLYILDADIDTFSLTELQRYGGQGVLLPLNDLIDQHAPNVKENLLKYPYYAANAYAPDGNIYGIPQLEQCYHCSYQNKLWINTKWLDQLGLSMPTTTEEYQVVLEAFLNEDPNGNGEADEVALSGTTESWGFRLIPYHMNAFIYDDDRSHLIINDGVVDIAANKQEWKEGLLYIKSLYDANLIDPGAFSQNTEGLQRIGNADPQLLGAATGMGPWFTDLADGSAYGTDYDPLPPLTGPDGKQYATFNPIKAPGASFVLTTKASPEVQEKAMQIVNYMASLEGVVNGVYGELGEGWRYPESDDVALDDTIEPLFAAIPRMQGGDAENPNDSWGNMAKYNFPKEIFGGWVQAEDIYISEGFERRLWQATTHYDGLQPEEVFPYFAVWYNEDVIDEQATLQQNITDYVNQNSLQFITGSKDIESEWDAYVEGLDQLGLDRYLEIMQQAYDDFNN